MSFLKLEIFVVLIFVQLFVQKWLQVTWDTSNFEEINFIEERSIQLKALRWLGFEVNLLIMSYIIFLNAGVGIPRIVKWQLIFVAARRHLLRDDKT